MVTMASGEDEPKAGYEAGGRDGGAGAEVRVCRRCGVAKPLGGFRPHYKADSGRSKFCRDCTDAAREQAWAAIMAARSEVPPAFNPNAGGGISVTESKEAGTTWQINWSSSAPVRDYDSLIATLETAIELARAMKESSAHQPSGAGAEPHLAAGEQTGEQKARRPGKWTREEDLKLWGLRVAGKSYHLLEAEMGRSYGQLAQRMHRLRNWPSLKEYRESLAEEFAMTNRGAIR
jgi:hypothetical protein